MKPLETPRLLDKLFNPVDLEPFGFSSNRSGAHMARSMMFTEIQTLCLEVPPSSNLEDYQRAVVEENILGKPTFSSRKLSFEHLKSLYGLDPSKPLFRVFRLLAAEEPVALPTLALVCCYCRDLQLRASFPVIEALSLGQELDKARMRSWLAEISPHTYSDSTLNSMAQNVNTTWTASGHLRGKIKKVRCHPDPHPAATAYAMFAGYVSGLRGKVLLDSIYTRLVLGTPGLVSENLAAATARGWLRYRAAGGILELDLSPLLTPTEREALHVSY